MGQGSIPKKFGTPYVFFATVEASNFKFSTLIGFGIAYQKTTFSTKIDGCLLGEHPKRIWDPLCIFSAVEASNFKFVTQFGFGTSLPKNNV